MHRILIASYETSAVYNPKWSNDSYKLVGIW